MKLTSTKDKGLQYVRALLHGDSGVGKTTSLGTLPVKGTTIVVGERGALPLRGKDYKVFQVDNWQDVQDIYGMFRNSDGITDEEKKAVAVGTRVLVFDSLTEISDLCQEHILGISRPAMVKERTRGDKTKPDNTYADLMGMEDWGLYRKRIQSLVSAFCHLPVHIIFTSLSAWHKDKGGGETIKTPNLPGKSAFEIPRFFDEVLYMKPAVDGEGKPTRVFQTFDDGDVRAKDSSGALAPIEPSNWTHVFKKILATGAKKNESA